jgi:hypothetical protein
MQGLKERVLKVMMDAFNELRVDLRPRPEQVTEMLDLLWDNGPSAGTQSKPQTPNPKPQTPDTNPKTRTPNPEPRTPQTESAIELLIQLQSQRNSHSPSRFS